MFDKTSRWLIYSVLFSLFPVIGNYLYTCLIQCKGFSLISLVSRGELLLISATIAASAIGEVLSSKKPTKTVESFFVGILILCVFTAATSFALLTGHQLQTTDKIAIFSIYFFLFTVAISGLCIILSQLTKEESIRSTDKLLDEAVSVSKETLSSILKELKKGKKHE